MEKGNSEYVNLCESFYYYLGKSGDRQACEESQHLQLYVGVKVHLVHMAQQLAQLFRLHH